MNVRQYAIKRFFPIKPRICRIAALMAAALALRASVVLASSHAPAGHAPAEHATEATSDADSNGIKLGEFKVRTDYPVEAQKCTVRFVLYASVGGDRLAEMRPLVAEHQQKVRDVVIVATRLAPLSVFEEPDLARFRRRLLIRLRRILPELAFDDLYISEFGLLVRSL